MHDERDLDLIDRRLIYELDRDSRQPITKIARKLRISSQKAEYRIAQLLKRNLIIGFPTVVDYKRFGYTGFAFVIKTRPIPSKEKEELVRKVVRHPNTVTFFEGEGAWNFYFWTLAQDVVIANETISQICEILKDYIIDSQLLVHTGAYLYGRTWLYDDEGMKETVGLHSEASGPKSKAGGVSLMPYGIQLARLRVDDTDMKILKWLSYDARISTIALAKKISSTPDIVRYRIKNLVKNGVIKRFTILTTPEKYGHYFVRVFIKLAINSHPKREEIRDFLLRNPGTFRVITVLGRYDMIIDTMIRKDEDLRDFLRGLADAFSGDIVEHEVMRITNIRKSNYFFTPP